MTSYSTLPSFTPTPSKVAVGYGYTVLFFTLSVSTIAGLAFIPMGPLSIVAFVAALIISGIGATIAAPVGILLALFSDVAVTTRRSLASHLAGQLLAGSVTGALAGFATAFVTVPRDPWGIGGWYIAVAAIITGACAATGWYLALRHERKSFENPPYAAVVQHHAAS